MTIDPLARLTPVVRLAPAKVNLTLAVLGRRPDGFHALHSVIAPVALSDVLSVVPADPGDRARDDRLHVRGFDPGPPEGNLVLAAIALVRDAVRGEWPGAPARPPALAVRLEKRIPVAAGLGGGSSDAAAALEAALDAFGATLPAATRAALAARLGSDVPFFLAGGPAIVEGRGERVTPVPGVRGRSPAILLVTPALAVSTAAVFAAFADGARAPNAGATRLTSEHLADELRTGRISGADLVARAGVLAAANDLVVATAAVAPELPAFRRGLARLLGRRVGQSGSGPTLWALYPSLDEARSAEAAVRAALDDGSLAPPGTDRPFVGATDLVVSVRSHGDAAGGAEPER